MIMGWFCIISTVHLLGNFLSDPHNGILSETLRFPFELYYTGFIGNIVMFAKSFLAAILLTTIVRDVMNLNYIKYLKYKIDNPSKGELK